MNKLLSKQEVADVLNVSVRTVSRIIKKSMLPIHRVERSIRIKCEDVEAYLEKRREEKKE